MSLHRPGLDWGEPAWFPIQKVSIQAVPAQSAFAGDAEVLVAPHSMVASIDSECPASGTTLQYISATNGVEYLGSDRVHVASWKAETTRAAGSYSDDPSRFNGQWINMHRSAGGSPELTVWLTFPDPLELEKLPYVDRAVNQVWGDDPCGLYELSVHTRPGLSSGTAGVTLDGEGGEVAIEGAVTTTDALDYTNLKVVLDWGEEDRDYDGPCVVEEATEADDSSRGHVVRNGRTCGSVLLDTIPSRSGDEACRPGRGLATVLESGPLMPGSPEASRQYIISEVVAGHPGPGASLNMSEAPLVFAGVDAAGNLRRYLHTDEDVPFTVPLGITYASEEVEPGTSFALEWACDNDDFVVHSDSPSERSWTVAIPGVLATGILVSETTVPGLEAPVQARTFSLPGRRDAVTAFFDGTTARLAFDDRELTWNESTTSAELCFAASCWPAQRVE